MLSYQCFLTSSSFRQALLSDSCSRINPCFTAQQRIRVWTYCHTTRGHRKINIFTSIVHGMTMNNIERLTYQRGENKSRNQYRPVEQVARQRAASTKIRVMLMHSWRHAQVSCSRQYFCHSTKMFNRRVSTRGGQKRLKKYWTYAQLLLHVPHLGSIQGSLSSRSRRVEKNVTKHWTR
jgi:hypothetical protein